MKNETAFLFSERTEFIKNEETFEKLIKIREESKTTASLLLDILQEINEIKESLAVKQSCAESKNGWKTERSVKFVYLFKDIEEREFYKIGISKNVRQRSLSVGARVDILAVGFGGDELEFQLHKRFYQKRVWHCGSREWFKLEKEDIQFVKNCIEAGRILEENKETND